MTDSLYDLAPAIIPLIALMVGLFVGRLLAIKPEKGEKGDPGPVGPMGIMGEPGRLEPHTHRIRDIEGLAEILGIHDQDEPRNGQ